MGIRYKYQPKPRRETVKMREYNRVLLAKITGGLVAADEMTKPQLLDLLTDQMEVEKERQSTRQFSFNYFRGESFSLSYWEPFRHIEVVLIPAGTPINEKNLTWAVQEMDKQQKELSTMFGRFYPG